MDLPPLQETMDLLQTAMKRWSDMGHGQVSKLTLYFSLYIDTKHWFDTIF